jgi:hypothetical protein
MEINCGSVVFDIRRKEENTKRLFIYILLKNMYMPARGSKHNFPKKRYNSISDSFKVSGSVLPLGYKPIYALNRVLNPVKRIPARSLR